MTIRKGEDFSEWYNEAVLKADLVDFASTKGFMFIKPYGYAIWENIQKALDGRLKEMGHKNAYAPAVIPEKLLSKEAEHVKGFAPECFYITHSGNRKLHEKLVLRPTSETIIYESYAKWVRSWRDLPLLLNYWNSVFRAEIKMTKLFLRTCEFLWQEGHTVHETGEKADKEVMDILGIYRWLVEEWLAIPVVAGRKSENEKFAGALYTTALEALMPDGRALQMGTSHNLGTNFSKAFGITFLDREEKKQYAWQTSWGVSTRMIGALVMVHGDDKGLVLPPKIAPVQSVIVPIVFEKEKEGVLEEARKLHAKLAKRFRVELDDREGYTAGWKFNHWELKGVPVRIEIGPKDIKNKQVVFARRDTGEKVQIKMENIENELDKLLEKMQKDMFARAKRFLNENIVTAKNFEECRKAIENRKIVRVEWGNDPKAEEEIKEKTGATIRIIPFDEKPSGKCFYTGKKAEVIAYFAKAY